MSHVIRRGDGRGFLLAPGRRGSCGGALLGDWKEQEREDPDASTRKGSVSSQKVINAPIRLDGDEGKHNRRKGEH